MNLVSPSDAAQEAVEAEGLAWTGLMVAAQDGDKAAYRRLLSDMTPYLRKLARRHHRDSRDVEDSVQDILLTVHLVRQTYDPARPFKPWLVAIARRRIIDRLRSQRRVQTGETILAQESETFSEDQTNPYEAESDGQEVHRAISQLPPGQREAVTLLKIKELSLKEASAASGMSVASLKVSTHRALKSLRKILEKKES